MTRFILIACLIAFVVPSQVSAQVAGGNAVSNQEMIDVIYLRDGKIVRGKILEKTDSFLIVRASDGSISTFQMDQVAGTLQEKVDIRPRSQQNVPKEMIDVIYLRDGKIVRGKILEKTDSFLIVRASDGSISTFQADQIAATIQEEAGLGTGGGLSRGTEGGGSSIGTGGNRSSIAEKNPQLAMLFSFIIPGAGQVYNGQTIKGGMYFGGAVSGIVVWSNFNTVSSSGDILSGNFNVKGPSPIRYVGLLIWAGAWIGSIYDAGKSANEINKKNGYGHLIEFGDERVVLGVDPVDQRNRLGTALTLHF